ncbi:unnamed protein product [Sphenostylis stenocarpa]|uniref:Uncharacterized protein n=1 Tax=Sphenostylis stenocarpa TaxID=92480 RepID=A0AA86VZL7_9FABA|nr:unnamed protein product [Sphenostylis stenocarpa]
MQNQRNQKARTPIQRIEILQFTVHVKITLLGSKKHDQKHNLFGQSLKKERFFPFPNVFSLTQRKKGTLNLEVARERREERVVGERREAICVAVVVVDDDDADDDGGDSDGNAIQFAE